MIGCRLANQLWIAANRRRWRRFRRALADPGAVQGRLLRRYLAANADTCFGREHGFDRIRTGAEFQRRVPLGSYDEYEPWIARIRAGEPGVLTREPIRRLVPSSGSSAARKLIPYNRTLLDEFNRGIGPWIVDLYGRHPDLAAGRAYWSISPPPPARPEQSTAVPIGFDEDSTYLGGALKRLVDQTLAVPGHVAQVADYRQFVDATLVHLLRARDLRLISVWHPSFLTLLLAPLGERWESLIEAAGRRDLRGKAPADWRSLWPRLGLISCWGDANAAGALAELSRRFDGVKVQPKGLIATEAFVTLPFADAWPVAVGSHFFEFLDEDGRPHLVADLVRGGEYSVVVTTGGGLYRYRLCDRVRVEGFLGATASLRFLGKEDQVTDLRGEKLNESHVTRVLGRAAAALGLEVGFAMLAPDEGPDGLGYTLYVQSHPAPPPELAARVHEGLLANPHYRGCIALGQLTPVRAFTIRGPAHHVYLRRCQQLGRGLGQIKPSALSRANGWSECFEGDYQAVPEPAGRGS